MKEGVAFAVSREAGTGKESSMSSGTWTGYFSSMVSPKCGPRSFWELRNANSWAPTEAY